MSRNVRCRITLTSLSGSAEICLAGDKLLSDIRTWLSPPDPWKNYNIARKSRHGETGAWFVKSSTLSGWKESGRSSLLWIHGKRQLHSSTFAFADTDSVPFRSGRWKERHLVC